MTLETPVTASVYIEAPPERVFSFFTDAEKVCRWLAQWAEVDPRPGGQLNLNIEGTPVRGRYVEIEPDRRLVLAWGHAGSDELPPESSRVEIGFSAERKGTRIDLVHRDLPAPQQPSHHRGWRTLLTRLADLDSSLRPADGGVRLLLISGSLRAGSTNSAALRTLAHLATPGLETDLYGGMGSLPLFNPDDDREGELGHPAVRDLRERVAWADGLVLCTPEYAGALPGALKNLLEWTVGDSGTQRKPVAWLNVSGPAAPTGGADAHDSLRKVLGFVNADIVERACVRVALTRDDVGQSGLVERPAARQRIEAVLRVLTQELQQRVGRALPSNG